jgi:ABC-type spermidine/putrescine transport system permease subunit II
MDRISTTEKFCNLLKQVNLGTVIQMSVAALVLFMVLYPVGWLCMGSLRTEPFTPDYTLAWYVKIFTDS